MDDNSNEHAFVRVELNELSQERWNIMQSVNKRISGSGVRITMGPMGFFVETEYPRRFMDGIDLTVPGTDNVSRLKFDNLADAVGVALDHFTIVRLGDG